MQKLILTFFLLLASGLSPVFAASLNYGATELLFTGDLRASDGCYVFRDGTSQCSAVTDTNAVWGQITGILANQTDLQNQLNLKEDKSAKNDVSGYAGLDQDGYLPFLLTRPAFFASRSVSVVGVTASWVQNSDWVTLPEFDMSFTVPVNDPYPYMAIRYTDNIGTYHTGYCNVGIFLDDMTYPLCFATWSGAYNTMQFRQESIDCSPYAPMAGVHTLHVKHRSQTCMYGNSVPDQYGAVRSLTVKGAR